MTQPMFLVDSTAEQSTGRNLTNTPVPYNGLLPECSEEIGDFRINVILGRVRGKAISMTYCECVALVIQHAMRVRHIVICGLPCCKKVFHIS